MGQQYSNNVVVTDRDCRFGESLRIQWATMSANWLYCYSTIKIKVTVL